jgi:hypothetical protein
MRRLRKGHTFWAGWEQHASPPEPFNFVVVAAAAAAAVFSTTAW